MRMELSKQQAEYVLAVRHQLVALISEKTKAGDGFAIALLKEAMDRAGKA